VKSPSLREIQEWMHLRLTQETGRLPDAVEGSDAADRELRLSIYREAYGLRLVRAIRSDFESLVRLLGEALFSEMAHGYLRSCPPDSFTLADAGRRLPDWLASTGWGQRFPLAIDLARLEWAANESFYAPEAPASFPFESRSPERWGRVVLDPSLRFVETSAPVLDFWSGGRETRASDAAEFLLVRRDVDGEAQAESVRKGEFLFMRSLATGTTLLVAAEESLAADPDLDLSAFLPRARGEGLVLGLVAGDGRLRGQSTSLEES
jgi:hypothetical protein